jgi:hypothetical protein
MNRRRTPRGQAIVEFAVTFPIFILLLVSLFDLGHVVWINSAQSNAAREGVRFAIVHGGSDSTECPVGPPGPETVIPPSGYCSNPVFPVSPSKQAIKDEVSQWLIGVGGTTTVSVCYGDVTTCAGDVDYPGATNVRGTKVTVTVTTTTGLAAPSLLGLGDFTLSATSTMLVNH